MPLPFSPHFAGRLLALTLLLVAAAPVLAAPDRGTGAYFPITMTERGAVEPKTLDTAVEGLRRDLGTEPGEIVVLVHGFNTSVEWGSRQYEHIASDLRKQAAASGLRIGVVGVHWPSYPGPAWQWLPQVVGYRAVSELGFRNALRNPYRERMLLGRRTGRLGLRSALFRFQDQFPHAHFHVLAHSLGSEMTLRALAPEARSDEKSPVIEQPARVLRVSLVTLAGADLDEDVFSSRQEPYAREALNRAQLWWVTVPKGGFADAVLELRRGAGRRDALGNRGLTLYRADLTPLLQRIGLVIDDQQVPITHAIEDYYALERLKDTLAAMAFLRDPTLPAAKASLPAALQPDAAPGSDSPLAEISRKIYALWRTDPTARAFGGVLRISRDNPAPAPARVLSRRLVLTPAG